MAATRWILGVSLLSTICVALAHQTGTNLVYVHAAVTTNDSFERPIIGLSHGSFKVLEDNKEQRIEDFSADAIPFSAPQSFSMEAARGKIWPRQLFLLCW